MSGAALSVLLESAPDMVFERRHLELACGDRFDALRAAGYFSPQPASGRVICHECGAPHYLSVERGPDGPRAYCADGGGWFAVGSAQLDRFVIDEDQLWRRVAGALSLRYEPKIVEEGVCMRLGVYSIDDASSPVFIACEALPVRVALALCQRVTKGAGVLLVTATQLDDFVGFGPWRVFGLADIVTVEDDGTLSVDRAALPMLFGVKRLKRGQHGAPHNHPKLIKFLDERIRSGAALKSPTKEARHALANASVWRSAQQLPNEDSLRMLVRRRRGQK